MRQLTALDAQFLHANRPPPRPTSPGVAILDPACAPTGAVTREALIGLLRERLHLAPALSLRLAGVPFGLDIRTQRRRSPASTSPTTSTR